MRGNRIDGNTTKLVSLMEGIGAQVKDYSQFGSCGHDKVVLFRGQIYIVEIKDGDRPPSQRKLTECELRAKEFYGEHYHVIETEGDVFRMFGINNLFSS